jgi:hypothetical protein
MQHFSDCYGRAIFRISSTNSQYGTILIKIRCNLTCFRPIQSFNLLGRGSMSPGCSQNKHKSVAELITSTVYKGYASSSSSSSSSSNNSNSSSSSSSRAITIEHLQQQYSHICTLQLVILLLISTSININYY